MRKRRPAKHKYSVLRARALSVGYFALAAGLCFFGLHVPRYTVTRDSAGLLDVRGGGLIEGAWLKEQERSSGFPVGPQEIPGSSQRWQLAARPSAVGEWIRLALPSVDPGEYLMDVALAQAPDNGVIDISVGNGVVAPHVDLFHQKYDQLKLDGLKVALTGENDFLKISVVGKNQMSWGYAVGLQSIRLTRLHAP